MMSRRFPGQVASFPGAIAANGLVWTSGVVSPAALAGEVTSTTVQITDALSEFERLLSDAGSSLGAVVSVTAYLADVSDFAHWNALFAATWPDDRPARTTIQVGFVAPEIRFEISGTALRIEETHDIASA